MGDRRRYKQSSKLANGDRILYTQTAFGRFSHWTTVVLLSIAIATGLYMGNPYNDLIPMLTVRYIHMVDNMILTGLVIARLYFAFVSGDYRNFAFHRGDGRKFVGLMAYYLFLAKEPPYEETKYNVGQRLIYVSWIFAWLFQAVTGFILATSSHASSILASTFFGGLQTIRLCRYLIAVYFVVTICIHIYLALTSDPAKFQAMFSGFVRVKNGETDK